MTRSRFITFRGEEREVEYDVEGNIGDHEDPVVIMWWFAGLDQDAHKALNITDEEDSAIDAELYECYTEEAYDGDPF